MSSKPIGRVVLHIGPHKTGSSSIQRSLANVDHEGFRYADLGSPNHSGTITTPFDLRRAGRKNSKRFGLKEQVLAFRRNRNLERIRSNLTEPRRVVLFSSEELDAISEDAIRALTDFLHQYTDDIRIVGFARAPMARQASMLQQRVKGGGYDRDGLPGIGYSKFHTRYANVLGADKITLLPFVPAQWVEGSLVKTLLHAIGEDGLPFTEVRSNESMGCDAVKLLYFFSRYSGILEKSGARVYAMRKLRFLLAEHFDGPKITFPAAASFREPIEREVNWLWETTGIDFRHEVEGMSASREEANAVFQAVMNDIPDEVIARLHDLEEGLTGKRRKSTIKALRALYDAGAKEVKREGKASDERIAEIRAEAGLHTPVTPADAAPPSRKQERRRQAFEQRLQELRGKGRRKQTGASA